MLDGLPVLLLALVLTLGYVVVRRTVRARVLG